MDLTFSDILSICQKGKRKIFFWSGLTALLALLFTLTRPVEYVGEATFREKAKGPETTKSSALSQIIGLPELNENAAISLMKSRKLIERAILNGICRQALLQPALRSSLWPISRSI